MKLLLDAGNSRLKWAWWGQGAVRERGALDHGGATCTQWSGWMSSLAPLADMNARQPPTQILCVEVLGTAFREALGAWARDRGWPAPRFLSADPAHHGIISDYHDPSRLGLDRYAAMAGARALGHESAVIIDCGTAVTLDRLDPGGHHRGGLILPGLGLMRRSLGVAPGISSGLPEGRVDRIPAVCTADAVATGTLMGLAAAIDHLSGQLLPDASGPVPRLLTGGDAPSLAPHLAGEILRVPDLVFTGLARMGEGD